MAAGQMTRLVHDLRQAAIRQDGGSLTDAELLGAFITQRDESAFAALVRRHGPMVLGVCQRVLADTHDAEDAFQATFLVLVRRAAAIRQRETVGNWLYGVAHRTAMAARRAAAKREAKEKQVKDMPHPAAVAEDTWHELQPLLDQELSQLADRYRLPVVLCDLEGRTRKEVARQLKIPEGTLSNRLATARKMLARRLARHGLTLSGPAVAALLCQGSASASVPAMLAASSIQAATALAVGQTATGIVSAKALTLSEGVVKAMFLTKLKLVCSILLFVSLTAFGTRELVCSSEATEHAAPMNNPVVQGKALAAEQPKKQPPWQDPEFLEQLRKDQMREAVLLLSEQRITNAVRKWKTAEDEKAALQALNELEEAVQKMKAALKQWRAQKPKEPAEDRTRQKPVSLILARATAERGNKEVLFRCETVLDNATGKELTVLSRFASAFDGLELVVTDRMGKALAQQSYVAHQSPTSTAGKFPLKQGSTSARLTFPVEVPRDVKVVKVRLVGTLTGSAYPNILSSETLEINIRQGEDAVEPPEPKFRRPPKQIQGVINKVDAKDCRLVEISIGSNAGLEKGHTLDAFRLTPTAKYLGIIQILDVHPERAIGKQIPYAGRTSTNAPLQAGDRVAAHLFPPGPTPGCIRLEDAGMIDPAVIVSRTRKMNIPVHMMPQMRTQLREVRLASSADQGKTWQIVATISADQDGFAFCAPEDGLYWLAVQSVSKDGKESPSDYDLGHRRSPDLKILVDTSQASSR